MDVRSNEPYWLIKNALPKSYPSLKASLSKDILIIGGGITGALMAYKLITEGKHVVLVERRDVCNGSTAASTSMLQYEIDTPLHQLIEQRGLTCAVTSYRQGEKAIKTIHDISKAIKSDCHFSYKKSVYFCSSKKDIDFLKKEYKARKVQGFSVTWLDAKALGAMGLNAVAAIVSKCGAVMDVYKFANDLLKHCSEKGLQVYDRTSVETIQHGKQGMVCTLNNGHTINSQHVIHCTGYESVETLKDNIIDLKSTYALASEAFETIPQAFKDHIFWNTDEPYLYFRATSDNRLIVGGGDEAFKYAKKRDALLSKKETELSQAFSKCFPNIPFVADYSWAGTFGETKDGLPYMGQPHPEKNEHYILGFGGNGITFSVMGMDAIVPSLEGAAHAYLDYYRFGR